MKLSRKLSPKLALRLGLVAIALPSFAVAQSGSSTSDQPAAQDDWYDPTDFYDDDHSISEEYSDSDYYDEGWDGINWHKDFDQAFNQDFGVSYTWDADEGDWGLVYDDDFDFDGSAKEVFGNEALADPAVIESRGEPLNLGLSEVQLPADSSDASDKSDTGAESGKTRPNDLSPDAMETLNGTLLGFRKIEVGHSTGSDRSHALARVDLGSGDVAVVDLGLAALWEGKLGSGDEVTFHGSEGEMDGKRVFVAAKVTAKGETTFINRVLARQTKAKDDSAAADSGKSASNNPTMMIEGQIAEMATVNVDGKDQAFLKVQLQSGRSATVSLGSGASVAELDLKTGDQLRVEGELKRIEGKKVIAAVTVSVDGEKVKG